MPSLTEFLAPQALLRGAFCFLLIGLLSHCDSKEETPHWEPTGQNHEVELTTEPLPPVTTRPLVEKSKAVTFMAYNLRNYLSMQRGASRDNIKPKPPSEVKDLVQNIIAVSPDILGVCEIGTQADLDDLIQQLASVGLHYPHHHLCGGADSYRRQAILSKLPLRTHQAPELTYMLDGKKHMILRGILDVTIELPSGPTRFLGVHLKSKRPSKYWDQAQIRRREAALVRKHVDAALNSGSSHIVLFGDFNDTKQSPSIRTIVGNQHQENFLRAVKLADSGGDKWTHYWSYEDVYSRFDYIFVSTAMHAHIDAEKSFIPDISENNTASDHRPLVISIR